MKIDAQSTWYATQTFFMSIGAVGLIAFSATLQWWLILIETGVVALTWYLIYRLVIGLKINIVTTGII